MTLNMMSEPNNNYVRLYNAASQLENFNSDQMATNSQIQSYAQDFRSHTAHFLPHDNVKILSTNADFPGQVLNLPVQPYAQDVRSHATSLPLHSNVHMNTMHYGNIGNRINLSPSASYYGPVPDVDVSITEQLNTPNCNKIETQKKGSCPLCGSSNGNFGTIKSIAHTFTQMRTQANVLNEPEYVITREVRIQLVIGRVPANASFSQVLALTQQ
ncbi:5114_t:CDS:1 [Paraglomus occultum]|uniref:5114_t:CDS:1 n=1 Tax=Paraglomus occultum TaxID=144539 RepID=A0A9N9ATK1_9GLOM|nr:5114_t:CDS:1 [Paraglomus occultum]